MSRFIYIANIIHAMVMLKFGRVFCISVYFEKGIMNLTLDYSMKNSFLS